MNRIYGVQHIGFTVPDMDEAVDFFVKNFDAEVVMECGAVDVDDAFMKKRLGVRAGRKIVDQRVLQVGKGGALELFQYSGEEGDSSLKANSEVGGWHLAFEVEDAFKTAEKLEKSGVDLMEGPTTIEEGPMAGLTWLYLKAPWGQFLEILSIKSPLGYEASSESKMYSPKEDYFCGAN